MCVINSNQGAPGPHGSSDMPQGNPPKASGGASSKDAKTAILAASITGVGSSNLKTGPDHATDRSSMGPPDPASTPSETFVGDVVKAVATSLEESPQASPKGHILIVGGHSTAGKTTFINKIMEKNSDHNELGIDITPPRIIYDYLGDNHQKFGVSDADWKLLHEVLVPREENYHIHDAVDEGKFQFLEKVSEEDKSRAKEIAEKLRIPCREFIGTLPRSDILVMNKASELMAKGKNVIMDTVNIDKLDQHPLHEEQVTTVLVYCKLNTLAQRVKTRTLEALASGHPENIRAGTFPLDQWVEVFGPRKKEDKDDEVVDTVSKNDLEHIIKELFDEGVEDMKRKNPQLYSQKMSDGSLDTERRSETRKFLEKFGFSPSDAPHKTVELTPRSKWTKLVDTSTSPVTDEMVEEILRL